MAADIIRTKGEIDQRVFQRLTSLLFAFVLTLMCLVTPASAADTGVSGVVQDFFEWSVNSQRAAGDAFWRAIYGDSWNPDGGFSDGVGADRTELVEKYSAYTDTMQSELGSTTLVDGGSVRRYIPYDKIASLGTGTTSNSVVYESPWLMQNFTQSSDRGFVNTQWTVVNAPFAGHVRGGHSFIGGGCFIDRSSLEHVDMDVTLNQSISGPFDTSGTVVTIRASDGYYGQMVSYSLCMWLDFAPASDATLPTTVDIDEPSRAGSIAGDVYVVNENGEETVYNDYSVVNETTNIYNDPISGTERPMEDWAYDYIERQYNITLEDGANVTIKYGDENIEIVEGDSIETLNYGSGSSGDGGESDDDSSLGDAVGGLLGGLGDILAGLIEGLLRMAASAVDALGGLIDLFNSLGDMILGFFGGFTDFLGAMFPFLPEETFTILNFGLILLIVSAVIKKLFL